MLARLIFRHKGSLKSDKSKVLIIFGDASDAIDSMYPYFRLILGRARTRYVRTRAGRIPKWLCIRFKQGWTITPEWEGYAMPADIAFNDVNPEEYPGILFSGGHAPEYIREDEDFLRLPHCFLRRTHP
jgi:protease I